MDEPPRRYNLTITMAREGGRLRGPVSFAAAADRAAWRRSASIVSAYTADPIITVVIVHAPSRYAAVAVARAVISEALQPQLPASSPPAGEARGRAAVPRTSAA